MSQYETMSQWTNNKWGSESMKQRSNEPINQWIIESMNQWSNEWTNDWMDEWATSLLSYFFTEGPLGSGTSFLSATPSLSSSLFALFLLWPASSLSCLPATFSVASATHFSLRATVTRRLATSSGNPAQHKGSTIVKHYLQHPLAQLLQCVQH